MNRRLRLAFLTGAEEWARRDGAPLSAAELRRILRGYRGDVGRRSEAAETA